ncbi:acid sphingomyelinase-like phosphodiesterase 3b [Polypterus senegalus]|uniref:acid sphingomyelinase-like phosphodiesterase 3b n=1 Tax=Polypterus senegalus TaxID=55291 RepID=UPI001962B69C|nr:acid sphingomyelinase-like phosphodiesterase 3b [Polypterus senegalus]
MSGRLTILLLLLNCSHGALALSGYFWHISDLHLEPEYKLSNDLYTVCPSSGPNPALSAGPFGDYHCDSPWALIESSIKAMKQFFPTPDFIFWTGDDTPHVADSQLGSEKVFTIIQNLTTIINKTFPAVAVYSTLGNHDFHPKSQLPPGYNDFYERIASLWGSWLGNAQEKFKDGAYYKMTLSGQNKFHILVLNTNLYYEKNMENENLEDPGNQFKWLENELSAAVNLKDKVYIIGHVPPGMFEKKRDTFWFRPNYNKKYIEIIQKYHSAIAGQFFGHQHTDSFRMFYDNKGNPISTMFLTPAITPWKTTLSGVVNGANNPGIRLFEYDKDTLLVKDMVTYYLNLTYANRNSPRWEKEYRLSESFNVPDGSPVSMHEVLHKISTKEFYLQKYYQLNSVNYDLSECNAHCRAKHVCAIKEVDFSRYKKCILENSSVLISVMSVFWMLPLVVLGEMV